MRFFNYLVFSFLFAINARAQQNHFIYIQTEDKQAFYVKLNEKIFSSTATGYVIIPGVADGQYTLSIGFPKNEWPSQNIALSINDRDEGYILRNFDSKVWGLFNLQTMAIVFATDAPVISKRENENKTDAFSNTLAEVTNTPSIRQSETEKEQPAKGVSGAAKEEIKKEEVVAAGPTMQISQVLNVLDGTGRSIIYAINDGNKIDSVRLFIPYENNEDSINATSKTWGEVKAAIHDSVAGKDTSLINPEQRSNVIAKTEDKPAIKDMSTTDLHPDAKSEYKVTMINPACKSNATPDDLSKLGKKMSAAANDDDRIAAAKKVFKSKCFTSEQIRNLCSLFSGDEGRYNFFDAAYSHVSDSGNFKDLQSQLTDDYYITRFKAMLR